MRQRGAAITAAPRTYTSPIERLRRRVRFGPAIVIVSGLPRAGASMMMQMLGAGGLPLVTEGRGAGGGQVAGDSFELEAVKDLDKGFDLSWLEVTRAKAVMVPTRLLVFLPECYNYRVILMQRPLEEVIASQHALLACSGDPADAEPLPELIRGYGAHMQKVRRLLASQACFESLTIEYHDVLANPFGEAERVRQFVGHRLAVPRMAAVVDARLSRSRIRQT